MLFQQDLIGLVNILAPYIPGIMDFDTVIGNLKITWLFRTSGDNQLIVACVLEHYPEPSASPC